MKKEIEILRDNNCDVKGAIERFVGDEELYVSFLSTVLNDQCFEQLGQALQKNDSKTAFECAHTLKGILGNMGLTPLYTIDVELVEMLRNGELDGVVKKFEELCKHRDKFIKMLE